MRQPDEKNEIIGSPVVAPGVIRYPNSRQWGLCASVTGARYTTTTEVYPDSPRATPEQCIAAQVAAARARRWSLCVADAVTPVSHFFESPLAWLPY